MDRRKLLYNLTALSAATVATRWLTSLGSNRRRSAELSTEESSSANQECHPYKPLSFGLMGVGGVGVYYLYEVARQLGDSCRTLAIETNWANDRLCWCQTRTSLLIGKIDEIPSTIEDANSMARHRQSDIAMFASGLDAVFLLTGLNGISGKGLAFAVAESLGEAGVFTIAIVPGARSADGLNPLRSSVNATFEIPYSWQAAPGVRDGLWREHSADAIAQKCRDIMASASDGILGRAGRQLLADTRPDKLCKQENSPSKGTV